MMSFKKCQRRKKYKRFRFVGNFWKSWFVQAEQMKRRIWHGFLWSIWAYYYYYPVVNQPKLHRVNLREGSKHVVCVLKSGRGRHYMFYFYCEQLLIYLQIRTRDYKVNSLVPGKSWSLALSPFCRDSMDENHRIIKTQKCVQYFPGEEDTL